MRDAAFARAALAAVRPNGGAGRFARRTTAPRPRPWSAAAGGCARARSRSRITACCSSTSCPSTGATYWRRCASRSKPARSASRAQRGSGLFPARFQLVAAMNPCPCGYAGDPNGRCRCTQPEVRRYLARLSGPLLDRIDLHVDVPRLEYAALRSGADLRIERGRRRARAPRPRTAARTRLPQLGAGRRTARGGLWPRPARARPAGFRVAPARPVGSRLSPHPARRAHDRGSRGREERRGRGAVGGDRLPAARSRARGCAPANGSGPPCVRRRHADGVVGKIHAAALRGHHARCALEACDGVLFERRLALRDARRPGGLVADPAARPRSPCRGRRRRRTRRPICRRSAARRPRPAPACPRPESAACLIASAELSSPATATCPKGLMRSCADACISGSPVSRAPLGPLSTRREMPIRTSAIAIRMPSTALKTLTKCRSCFAMREL